MVMSCSGSLLGWQFTIAQVFKSSADEGYFPKVFSRVTKVDAPVQGMLIIVIIQTGLSLMTISPSLNSQFNVLVNLAVVTNIIPYILSMAALVIIQENGECAVIQKRKSLTSWPSLAPCIASTRSIPPVKKPCCTAQL